MAAWWSGANAAAAAGAWVQEQSYHHPASNTVFNGFAAASHHPGGAEYLDSAPAAFNGSAFVAPPGFMSDCYKSTILPSGFLAPPPPPSAGGLPGFTVGTPAGHVGSAGSAGPPSSRSHRRYTGRSTCDCPNCQEADRLGPAAALHLRKRSVHSCHLPGCGKV